jgi:hypothetical protein
MWYGACFLALRRKRRLLWEGAFHPENQRNMSRT